jgi:hypothetical protein
MTWRREFMNNNENLTLSNSYENISFFIKYSFLVFILTLFSFYLFRNSKYSELMIRLKLEIPIISQCLLSFIYFLKNKNRLIFFLWILCILEVIIYNSLILYELKYLTPYLIDDLIFYVLYLQIFFEIIIIIFSMFNFKNFLIIKNMALMVLPLVFFYTVTNALNYIDKKNIINDAFFLKIFDIIQYFFIQVSFIFSVPLMIINIFNPVLIYALTSIDKGTFFKINKNES